MVFWIEVRGGDNERLREVIDIIGLILKQNVK